MCFSEENHLLFEHKQQRFSSLKGELHQICARLTSFQNVQSGLSSLLPVSQEGLRRHPQYGWVKTLGIQLHHLREELQLRRIGREEAFGIVEVFPSRSNVRRVIVASLVFVTRNYPGRIQCFDDVERVKPGIEASVGGFDEVLVDSVVDHVSSDDDVDHGHVRLLGYFTMHSVVLEYVTVHLGAQAGEEMEQGRLSLLIQYRLCEAQARDYVRLTQERLLVAPLFTRLQSAYRGRTGVEERLRFLLDQ